MQEKVKHRHRLAGGGGKPANEGAVKPGTTQRIESPCPRGYAKSQGQVPAEDNGSARTLSLQPGTYGFHCGEC